MAARLALLVSILRQHNLSENDVNLDRVIRFGAEGLGSLHPLVLQNAYLLLLTIYEQVGYELIPHLDSLSLGPVH